jgi:predicted ArsR family transcriptional regulator
VAGRLGVPPTRLYHHVHKLIEVELLEVAAERPNRGTTEKLLRTRRREFRESVSGSDSAVYAVALHDGLAALSQDGVAEEPGSGVHTMSVSTRVSATPAALEELTTFVSDWVRRNRTKEGGIPIHLALALFRVDGQR